MMQDFTGFDFVFAIELFQGLHRSVIIQGIRVIGKRFEGNTFQRAVGFPDPYFQAIEKIHLEGFASFFDEMHRFVNRTAGRVSLGSVDTKNNSKIIVNEALGGQLVAVRSPFGGEGINLFL